MRANLRPLTTTGMSKISFGIHPQNAIHYTPSHPQKQDVSETFAPRHIINFATNHLSFNDWHGHIILLFLVFDELVHRRNHVLFTLNMKKFK